MKLSRRLLAGRDGAPSEVFRLFVTPEGNALSTSEKPISVELMSEPDAGAWTVVSCRAGAAARDEALALALMMELLMALSEEVIDITCDCATVSCCCCAGVIVPASDKGC